MFNRSDEERKQYRENEPIFGVHPDAEKIKCKDCVFRAPDNSLYKGCTKAFCEVYPKGKPDVILFKNAECEYYVSENDEDNE